MKTISNSFPQSSPLLPRGIGFACIEEIGQTSGRVERDKWVNGRVFRLFDHWIEAVVYTGRRHLRECRVALGIQLVLASSRNRGQPAIYIYMGSYLTERWNRPIQALRRRPRENSQSRLLVFHTKLSTSALFATISPAPVSFPLPPEPLLDFPPLTQPFKTRLKKAGILCFEIERKRGAKWLEKRNFIGNSTWKSEVNLPYYIYIIIKSTKQISIFKSFRQKFQFAQITTLLTNRGDVLLYTAGEYILEWWKYSFMEIFLAIFIFHERMVIHNRSCSISCSSFSR